MKKIILILTLILALSCQKTIKKEIVNVENEINQLKSIAQKNNYLEEIYNLDQNIRNGQSSDLLMKFGKNSNEFKNFIFKMDSIDYLNFKRIDLYLKTFNHPQRDSFSTKATITPWLVIHHNPNNFKRRKHFNKLYQAYKDNNITSNQLDFFLRRTYQIEFGENLNWEGAYNMNDKIDWMIKELNFK